MTGDASLGQSNPTRRLVLKLTYQVMIILVVVQITLIASWAWLWFLLWKAALNQPPVLQSAAVIGIACFSGLIARIILRGQPPMLRWLTALLSALASLVGTYLLTRGMAGFPLPIAASPATNWSGLAQVLAVGCLTWIVLFANWKKPMVPSESMPTAVTSQPTPAETLIEDIRQQGQPISLYRQRPTREDNLQQVVLSPTNPAWNHLRGRIAPVLTPASPSIHPKKQTAKRKTSRNTVRLLGEVEHRCPYCLQPVEVEDMNSVVVCPICNAHHHRSCWEITGACQVPHLTR